jgi:hypothetical protein
MMLKILKPHGAAGVSLTAKLLDKQYSRNVRTGNGTELVSITQNLVKNVNRN